MRRRAVARVVADQLHADPQPAQPRIVERRHVEPALPARHEHVGRAVVRPRRLRPARTASARRSRRRSAPAFERVADEAAALRPPGVLERRAAVCCEQAGDAVLEALARAGSRTAGCSDRRRRAGRATAAGAAAAAAPTASERRPAGRAAGRPSHAVMMAAPAARRHRASRRASSPPCRSAITRAKAVSRRSRRVDRDRRRRSRRPSRRPRPGSRRTLAVGPR